MADYTVWNFLSSPKLEIKDNYISKKVISILKPYILSDDVIHHIKNSLQNEISLGLSHSEECALPMTITFLTERFVEYEGEYVSICVHLNVVTVTLVRLKSGAVPEIHRKDYKVDATVFNLPYIKVWEKFAEYIKEFFYEFHLDGRTIPTGFCTDLPMKQVNLNAAIVPYFNKEHLQAYEREKDVKTIFEHLLCKDTFQNKLSFPVYSPSPASIPQANSDSIEVQNRTFDAKFLGTESVLGHEVDLDLCHKLLTKMQERGKILQEVTLEILHSDIKIKVKGLEDLLYQHSLNKISRITQSYLDFHCFGYVFGDYVKGHQLFGFKTECQSTEIMLILKDTFEQELLKKKKEELNMKASQVFLELKDFLNLAHKLKALEKDIPVTLKKRVRLVENICWWLEGCSDDVLATSFEEPEECNLNVKIQDLFSIAVEMKLANIEKQEEIQREVDKVNKKHRTKKKEEVHEKKDVSKRKKLPLHPNQVKVSQIIKEHVAYFETLLDNRHNKIEVLEEQMSKLDENNPENNVVEETCKWLESFCTESYYKEIKNEVESLTEKVESLASLESSERKNIQISQSETVIGNDQHLRTLQKLPDEPAFEIFNLKIPDRYNGKLEILRKIISSKRHFLTAIKVRREEVEQLNCFISELYFKINRIPHEESKAVVVSRKILVRAVKLRLKEIKEFETALSNLFILEENLTYAVPNALQFCKNVYDNTLLNLKKKIKQLEEIVSRIPESSKINISHIPFCKEVYGDIRNVIENEIKEVEKIIASFQSEENALELNVQSVCSKLYTEMVNRRKKESDVLVTNLDLLEETRMNDLNDEDTTFTTNIKDFFLTSIIVREKEIEWLEKEMQSGQNYSLKKNSNLVVRLKDLFSAALELEKRHYENILFQEKESKEVLPIAYSLIDLYDIVVKELQKIQMEKSTDSVSNKKLQVHASLGEFLSLVFDLKQKEFEIPLNELKQDLEKLLSNMIEEVKKREEQHILERNLHNQALKILNSWKELFLVAADIRKDELIKVIPAKIKDLKEEQAFTSSINSDELSNLNDKGTEIALFWQKILSNVVDMKNKEIVKIQLLLDNPENTILEEKVENTPVYSKSNQEKFSEDKHKEISEKMEDSSNSEFDTTLNKSKEILNKVFSSSTKFESQVQTTEKSLNPFQENIPRISISHLQPQQPNENVLKLMEYKDLLNSLEHKRLKQPTYNMSNWNDIIVRAFLIEQLETAKMTMGEESISIEAELISKYNLLNAFKSEYAWEEILVELFNLFHKEKDLSQLLQAKKETYIPLDPWTDVFKKAIYTWNEKITEEVNVKQNENMLLQWKARMDSEQYSEFVAGCNFGDVSESYFKDITLGLDMSVDIKELKEMCDGISKQSSMIDRSQTVTNNLKWENIFQESFNVITKNNDLANILKKQELNIQYQTARIHLPWNDHFIKTVKFKKEERENVIKEQTNLEKLAKSVHEKGLVESCITKPLLMSSSLPSWTSKAIEALGKQREELEEAVLIKKSEMDLIQPPNSIEFEINGEKNPLLKLEPEQLILHGKRMFLIALELRKAEVKAMEEALIALQRADVFHEMESIKSMDIWKKIVSTAVDLRVKGKQLKQPNKIRYAKSSEKLFLLAAKILSKELEMDISPKIRKVEESQNLKFLDNEKEPTNWEALFQKACEFITRDVQRMEKLGLKEMKTTELPPNNAYESSASDNTDLSDWAEIFIAAIKQTIKEMNPDQLNIQDIAEKDMLLQPLSSWNEIFFIMLNYSKCSIEDKLNSDSHCNLVDKEDLKNVQLLELHNVFSWDNLLIAAIEEYLQKITDNSNLPEQSDDCKLNKSYDPNFQKGIAYANHPKNYSNKEESGKNEMHFWISLLPTKNGAERFQAKENLLETEIKLFHSSPMFTPEKIPDDIIWKHMFPLSVIVWRRKMANYLKFNKLASHDCSSSEKSQNLTETMKIENTADQRNTPPNNDLSSHEELESIVNLTPEYFNVSISWREIFFAALERKKKILCRLIELKESENTNAHQKTSHLSAEKLQSITFSVNKVIDLPITQQELVQACNTLKMNKLVLHNEEYKEYSNKDSEVTVLQVDDIKPLAVIDEFKNTLSKGKHLRKIETSILQQEILNIENLPKKNKMALSSLKMLRKYYNGAIEFRQNEIKKIDNELAILKDVKDMFSEYLDFSKSNSIYHRNKRQEHLIKKNLSNLLKIQSDFDEKLVVHLNKCISDCKTWIDKRNNLNLQVDMKSVGTCLEKVTIKDQNLLVDCMSILRTLANLRKEELENIENELELMKTSDTLKASVESKVFDTFHTVLNFLSNAICERNNLIDLLSPNIEALKQIEDSMNAKVHTALTCCTNLFSQAIKNRKSEIASIHLELSVLKSNLNNENQKVSDSFKTCEHYSEKAISKRNLELQKLDSYLKQTSLAEVTDCLYNCTNYFSMAAEKRKQEIHAIQTLMEPLKKIEYDQEKDSELSSALDEALCNVFGIEPEITRLEIKKSETDDTNMDAETSKIFTDFYSKLLSGTRSEAINIEENLKVLETFKGEIAEKPIQSLGDFIAILIKENETIKHEIETLDAEMKIFMKNQNFFEIDVDSIVTTCYKHLSCSLDNTKEEIDELSFQLKILSRGLTKNDESQFEKLSYENLQLIDIMPSAFNALLTGSSSDENEKLVNETFTEVVIAKMQSAVKWRKVFLKNLSDDIKFLTDSYNKPIKILTSCVEKFCFVNKKRREENEEITSTLNDIEDKKNIDCVEYMNEILYFNNKALQLIENELNRLNKTFEFLQNEKNYIFSMCEEVISHIICKSEEEIQAMLSDLSHLQIMGSTEDTELLSNCKTSLKNGVEKRESEVKLMKKDLNQWPIETEIQSFVDSYGKHLRSCLERKETEVQNVVQLLKSFKEESGMSILLYSPILESVLNKNNAEYEWLQLEISKFVHIHKELDIQGKKIVNACHKLYCNFSENFKIEIEGILHDFEDLQRQCNKNPENDQLKDQQVIVSFNNLFMNIFNLKKKELEREVHKKSIQTELTRKQMDILAAENPDIKGTNVENKELGSKYGETNSLSTKNKKKEPVYEVSSLTQLNSYFDRLKDEKKVEIEKKVVNEFQNLERNFAFNQDIYFKVPQSQEEQSVHGSELNSKTETFTNRVYEIKLQQIEDEINLKRNKIHNVIMERKVYMDTIIESRRQEMENHILSKEKKIREVIDSVQNEDSQIVCSLKDIFHDVVELKNKERYTLQNVQQLDKYKDLELEALNVLVNLDNLFSLALNLKEEEIAMIKYSNVKEIEKSILLMKKECKKLVVDAKNKLEEALVKYRGHEKSRALIYTGLVKSSKSANTEEYIINDENIFPDIKAFEDFISTINNNLEVKQLYKFKNAESSIDVPFRIPYIRPYTYASHGLEGHLLKLYKDEVQYLSKVLSDITIEIDCAIQKGMSFTVEESSTDHSVITEKKEIQCEIVAILNRNTSMLMMGSFMDVKCDIALNLGNNFGLVYFEKFNRILKWISPKPDANEVSIDIGLKTFAFNDCLDMISTKFDWDVTTVPFCTSRFQRFISDAGLLEQIRFILLELHHQLLFCRKCDMDNISKDAGLQFEELYKFFSSTSITDALQSIPIKCGSPSVNDVDVAFYVIKLVLIRGALLTTICLAPILERSDKSDVGIITNSIFIQKFPEYQTYIKTFTSLLVSDKTIDFLFTNDVNCGIGAAMAACITFNINNKYPENLVFEFQSLLKQKSHIFHVKDFIKLLEDKQTSNEALELAYQYLKELKFDLPISVVWAYYFMNEQQEEADKLFQENPVSLRKVNSLIFQKIESTSNIELHEMYKNFVKQHCTDKKLKIKIFRCLFDFLVYRNLYDEAIALIQELAELDISLDNLRFSSLTKIYEFWLKNKSRYENISAIFLPLQETYISNSDSDF